VTEGGGALFVSKPFEAKVSMSPPLQWYAAYTRPRWEKKVAGLLTQKEVENYCPLQEVERRWSDRKKIVLEPLFKSYVFVHIPEKGHLPVVQTEGVLNLVNYQGKPAIIRNEEIEVIRRFLENYRYVQVEEINERKCREVAVAGHFPEEQHTSVPEGKKIKVLLPSIGFAMVAVEKPSDKKNSDPQ